jgi:hypothetical protein
MPCTKRPYLTEGHATAACKSETTSFTKHGAGAQARYLEAYQCKHCGFWHIGRAWKTQRREMNHVSRPAPQPKIPSVGELRRKLARLEREWDRANQHRAKVIGQLIEADRIALETENEMREMQRQVTAMFLPAPR